MQTTAGNVYLLIFPDELLSLLELLLGLVCPPPPLLRLLATPLPLTQQQVQHFGLHISIMLKLKKALCYRLLKENEQCIRNCFFCNYFWQAAKWNRYLCESWMKIRGSKMFGLRVIFLFILYIKQCCGSGMFFPTGFRIRFFSISDPNFFHPGSRICIKEFQYFNPKKWFLSSRKYESGCSPGSWIRILILNFYPSRILDPGIKKAPDPGSGSATLT